MTGHDRSFDGVRRRVARLLFECMGIPEEKSLDDLPLERLDPNFDSLSLLEIQLLLEKDYQFEFQHESRARRLRLDSTVSELARQAIESMAHPPDRSDS